MRRNLSGRKLVITGAARGIGEKVARLAAARGARVALIGLEPDRLRALADDLGPTASWREADVRDGVALRSAIDDCAMTMGGIDIVRRQCRGRRVRNGAAGRRGIVRASPGHQPERRFPHAQVRDASPGAQPRPRDGGGVGDILHADRRAGLLCRKQGRRGDARPGLPPRGGSTSASLSASSIPHGSTPTSSEAPRRTCPHSRNCARGCRIRAMSPRVSTGLAAAIVRGLVRRRSRIYVPRAVVVANWAKAALNSPAAWPWMRRFAAEVTPALEREVAALGRHDQLVPGADRSASISPANAIAIEPVAR